MINDKKKIKTEKKKREGGKEEKREKEKQYSFFKNINSESVL